MERIKNKTVYRFEAKLKCVGEDKYYFITFNVLAENIGKARTLLEKWLDNPEQTGYKYEKWVGITPLASSLILVEESESNKIMGVTQ